MRALLSILLDIFVLVAIVGTIIFLYRTYSDDVFVYLFGEQKNALYINDVSIVVTVADSPDERREGLSGLSSLPDKEGKLFVFDQVGDYGFWMKDMNFPIDIIWIDEDMKIVHIEKNVKPESYPAVYSSPTPSRFVLEVNAFFVDTFSIHEGDTVNIPIKYIPADLAEKMVK